MDGKPPFLNPMHVGHDRMREAVNADGADVSLTIFAIKERSHACVDVQQEISQVSLISIRSRSRVAPSVVAKRDGSRLIFLRKQRLSAQTSSGLKIHRRNSFHVREEMTSVRGGTEGQTPRCPTRQIFNVPFRRCRKV